MFRDSPAAQVDSRGGQVESGASGEQRGVSPNSGDGDGDGDEKTTGTRRRIQQILNFLGTMLVIFLLSRRKRLLARLMGTRAADAEAAAQPGSEFVPAAPETPDRAAANEAGHAQAAYEPGEVEISESSGAASNSPAPAPLEILECRRRDDLKSAADSPGGRRMAHIQAGERNQWLHPAVGTLTQFLAMVLIGAYHHPEDRGTTVNFALTMALVYAALYLIYRWKFKRFGALNVVYAGLFMAFLNLFAYFYAEDRYLAPGLLVFGSHALNLLAGAVFYFFIVAQRNALPNAPLLHLRVFDFEKNIGGVLKYLLPRWSHSGTVLLIGDVAFLDRYDEHLRAVRGFVVALWVLLTRGSKQLRRQFLKNADDIEREIAAPARRLTGEQQAEYDAENFTNPDRARRFDADAWTTDYRISPVYCYDDVWRPALYALADASRVVFMDLRGFQAKRQGCIYELEFLLNRVQLSRTILMTDDTTDRELLYELLKSRWIAGSPDSVNRDDPAPLLRVYYEPKIKRVDLRQVLRLLADAAESGARPPSGPESNPDDPLEKAE